MIDIKKQTCVRCETTKVSEKDKSGIFLRYHGNEAPLCNKCAVDLANTILQTVKKNGWEEVI